MFGFFNNIGGNRNNNNNNSDDNPDLSSVAEETARAVTQAFTSFFENNNDMAAALNASLQEQQQHPVVTASPHSIRQLPVVRVDPQDLLDPCNRTCAVCLQAIAVGQHVVRLPCAHLFDADCILPWLQQHSNSCPVCRYELPTDNPHYERERLQRMRHRKPRFARHELERLSVSQLQALLVQPAAPPQHHKHGTSRHQHHRPAVFADKRDLCDYLVETGAIELVSAAPPVSRYQLSQLQAMSIKQLKQTMNEEAGVFFDPRDVVEKRDLIHLFMDSGRLQVLPEDEEDDDDNNDDHGDDAAGVVGVDDDTEMDQKPAAVKNVVVETVQEHSDMSPFARTPRSGRELRVAGSIYKRKQHQ